MPLIHLDRLTRAAAVALALAAASTAAYAQSGYDPASAANMSLRITTLEDQIRQLNGQVEQLTFQVRQMQDMMRRMSEDTEYRFQEMGHGGVPATGPTATAQPQLGGQQPHVMQYPQQPSGQPQIMGQAPISGTGVQGSGQPLDLSQALGQPGSLNLGQPGGQPGQQGQVLGAPPQPLGAQLVAAPTNSPKDAYDLSYGYILRGEFDMAEASFRDFLTRYPGDELAGNAQYWLGESLYARANYRDAADAFLKGFNNYPDNAKAPDSLYKLGMSLKELGQTDAACSTFAELPRRYPRAPQAVQERARSEMQKSGC